MTERKPKETDYFMDINKTKLFVLIVTTLLFGLSLGATGIYSYSLQLKNNTDQTSLFLVDEVNKIKCPDCSITCPAVTCPSYNCPNVICPEIDDTDCPACNCNPSVCPTYNCTDTPYCNITAGCVGSDLCHPTQVTKEYKDCILLFRISTNEDVDVRQNTCNIFKHTIVESSFDLSCGNRTKWNIEYKCILGNLLVFEDRQQFDKQNVYHEYYNWNKLEELIHGMNYTESKTYCTSFCLHRKYLAFESVLYNNENMPYGCSCNNWSWE